MSCLLAFLGCCLVPLFRFGLSPRFCFTGDGLCDDFASIILPSRSNISSPSFLAASNSLSCEVLCLSGVVGPLRPPVVPSLIAPYSTSKSLLSPTSASHTFKCFICGGSFCVHPPWMLLAWFMRGPEGANALHINPRLASHHSNHSFSQSSSF